MINYVNTHRPHGPYERWVKRPLDCVLATAALIGLSPILAATAIAVRVKLGSPVLYSAERIGLHGNPFRLYKFRTMTDERNSEGRLLPDTDRLTDFGRLLRSTSVDELPELLNIVRGDMALIGPRPLPVSYAPFFTRAEWTRHDVRPGLSGWAQVNGRNSISWNEKFALDVWYAGRVSLPLDTRIIIETLLKVVRRKDIGQGEEAPANLYDERSGWEGRDGCFAVDPNGRHVDGKV